MIMTTFTVTTLLCIVHLATARRGDGVREANDYIKSLCPDVIACKPASFTGSDPIMPCEDWESYNRCFRETSVACQVDHYVEFDTAMNKKIANCDSQCLTVLSRSECDGFGITTTTSTTATTTTATTTTTTPTTTTTTTTTTTPKPRTEGSTMSGGGGSNGLGGSGSGSGTETNTVTSDKSNSSTADAAKDDKVEPTEATVAVDVFASSQTADNATKGSDGDDNNIVNWMNMLGSSGVCLKGGYLVALFVIAVTTCFN